MIFCAILTLLRHRRGRSTVATRHAPDHMRPILQGLLTMRLTRCPTARAATVVLAVAAAAPLVNTPAAARGAPDSFAVLAAKLLPAVVNISSTQEAQARAGVPGGPEVPLFPPGSPFEQFFKDFLNRNRPGQPRGDNAPAP